MITVAADSQPNGRKGWGGFLGCWSVLGAMAVVFLVTVPPSALDSPMLLWRGPSESAAPVPLSADLRRAILLTHLSLYRVYPWILLAPYVVWLTFRFTLERGRMRSSLPAHLLAVGLFGFSCWELDRRIAARLPARVVLVAETSTEKSVPVGGSNQVVERIARVVEISTNLASGNLTEPAHFARLLAAFSNTVSRLESAHPTNDPPLFPGRFLEEDHLSSLGNKAISPGSAAAGAPADVRSTRRIEVKKTRNDGIAGASFGNNRVLGTLLDLFAFASLVGLGHAVHFYRRFQDRERRALSLESSLTKARLHNLQAQLHPHFLFNSLNSVIALLRQNPRAAEEMLVSLSDLLRLALSQSSRQHHALRDELHFLDLYMEVQETRFGERLHYQQSIPPEALDCQVPSLLLQPLVENAIRHGIDPTGRPGTIRVEAALHRNQLELSVQDDGVGCPSLMDGTARLGVGLANVQERLRSLFDTSSSLAFQSGLHGGLIVRVTIPIAPSP